MNKRLFISLALPLALAAFAVMAVAAQAAPHWYKNGASIPAGVKIPVVEWGDVTLTSAAGAVTCSAGAAGYVENPEGGGAGVGTTESFVTDECATAECPSETRVEPRKLPWSSGLVEEAEVIRSKSTGIETVVGCWSGPPTGPEPAEQGEPGPLLPFAGELMPKVRNGLTAVKPTHVTFGAGSGELINEKVGGGKLTGEFALLGFTEQEVITAKNP